MIHHYAFDGRCGPELRHVLVGKTDPLELLFPKGSMDEAEALYSETPVLRLYNRLCCAAIQALTSSMDDGQMSLLEIGGGTGGTTSSILRILPSDCVEYWFTDLSEVRLACTMHCVC